MLVTGIGVFIIHGRNLYAHRNGFVIFNWVSITPILIQLFSVPNLNFVRAFGILYPNGPEISFFGWFLFATPLAFSIITCMWLIFICFFSCNAVFSKKRVQFNISSDIFKLQYQALGKVTGEEIIIAVLVVIMIVLWFTRLGFGTTWFSGWSHLLPGVDYGTIAIAVTVSLFIVPGPTSRFKKPLLNWSDMHDYPWDIILLLGGGYALAFGFSFSGLSDWIAEIFQFLDGFNFILIIIIVVAVTTFLTGKFSISLNHLRILTFRMQSLPQIRL